MFCVEKAAQHYTKMKTFNAISILCVVVVVSLLNIAVHANGATNTTNEHVSDKREARELHSSNKNGDVDGYVVEDMHQVQHDQPAFMRPAYNYNQMQKEAAMQDKFEQRKRVLGTLAASAPTSNIQFTKEIVIKQGRLKGLIRSMHPQTGLKNVRQYLGIPYAAAPIGNGRFMPPGWFSYIDIFFIFLFFVLMLFCNVFWWPNCYCCCCCFRSSLC